MRRPRLFAVSFAGIAAAGLPGQEAATVRIVGRIVTVTHDGVPAAEVWATDAAGQRVGRTVADGDGWYQLARLPAGVLRLHARGADKADGAMAVAASGPVREATLMLEDGEPLRGTVHGADGAAVAGAAVLVCAAAELAPPFDWCAETTTDAAGTWQLPSVPLRPLVVRVFVPGRQLAEQAVPRQRGEAVRVVMAAEETVPRRVRVHGAPVGQALVVRCDFGRSGGKPAHRLPRAATEAAVGPDGVARLWPLPAPHEVRVVSPQHRSLPVYVPCAAHAATALEFTLTPLPADLLAPCTQLVGRIVDDVGVPLAGVALVGESDGSVGPTATTAADGTFKLDVPVRTKVLCRLALQSRDWRLGDPKCTLGGDGRSWLTLPADPQMSLELHAGRAGSLRGTLLGPGGVPLAAARLQLQPVQPAKGAGPTTLPPTVVGASDAAGRVDLPGLPPGGYRLTATGVGGIAGTVAIDVRAGAEVGLPPLSFAPTGEVRGVVTGPDGRPLPSTAFAWMAHTANMPAALRRQVAAAGAGRIVMTDRHGRYRIPAVAPGDWSLCQLLAFAAPAGRAPMQTFAVAAGEVVHFDFQGER